MKHNYSKIFITILLLLVFVKCKTVSPDKKVSNEYIINCDSIRKGEMSDSLYYHKKGYMAVMKRNRHSTLREINGYALGKFYGHYFKFDFFGVLDDYKYIVDGSHYTYRVFYNVEDSSYSERGFPSVDQMRVLSESNKDSTEILFLFTKFPRQNIQVLYSIDGISYAKVANKKSDLMPFLDQGALKISVNVKKVFFKIETSNLIYKWPGLEEKKIFLDTTMVN
ncbi:hypothetical protein SAMN05518672_103449 [Chitinophaga sp. CF118]|uniref:hypothetical protein n=1 Tax=Chitinophaga sp. CF118 TaxID=1884367 RepID=UPI0008E0EFCE|nr:hypothetical protein [Chitinophaga sp. CF118]SFD83923.1 hypothetical protein SAMN05518672_103449 [Chitinophaga sp. CF118]